MDLECHLLRPSIALLKIDGHDINLDFSYKKIFLTGWKPAAPA